LADSKSDSIIGGHFATNPPASPLENPSGDHLDSPLWRYACQVYSQQGVEVTLLELQDDHGADINLILQALWLANEERAWTKECIPDDYAKWMDEQVLPLRQMRRSIKTDWPQHEDFRQQVKKLELKAEQYALALLYLNTDGLAAVPAAEKISLAEQNMRTLAEYLAIENTLLQDIAPYV